MEIGFCGELEAFFFCSTLIFETLFFSKTFFFDTFFLGGTFFLGETFFFKAFRFGNQKINLHVKGREFEPKAHLPVPGALDLCFIASVPLDEVMARLAARGLEVIEGPVLRTGATSRIRSVYLRDPDLNLIEISETVG